MGGFELFGLAFNLLTGTGQPFTIGTELDGGNGLRVTSQSELQCVVGFLEGRRRIIVKCLFLHFRELTTDPEDEDFDEEVLAAFELLRPPLLLPEDMGFGTPGGGCGGPCICCGGPCGTP